MKLVLFAFLFTLIGLSSAMAQCPPGVGSTACEPFSAFTNSVAGVNSRNATDRVPYVQGGATHYVGPWTVTSTAALQALSTVATNIVTRFETSNTGIPSALPFIASSSPCSLNGGLGDGESQVPSADGNCWLAQTATYKPFIYGYGNNAAIDCKLGNQAVYTQCPVNGAIATDPTSAAWYPSTDVAGDVVYLPGTPPWMANVTGTISGNVFTPSSALSPTQVGMLRLSQVLHTNSDSPACDGIVSAFASDGSTVTVQGWFKEGFAQGSTPSCTPAFSNNVTNRFTKLYGRNTVVSRFSTTQEKATIGHEYDIVNSSGTNDTCPGYDLVGGCGFSGSDGAIDIIPLGTNTVSFGLQIRGSTYVAEETLTGAGTWGILMQPTGGGLIEGIRIAGTSAPLAIGLSLVNITGGDAIRTWDGANISFEQKMGGNTYFGNQSGTSDSPNLFFYSSAHGVSNPDVEFNFSSGTGALDGFMTINAGEVLFTNTAKVAGAFILTPTTPGDTSPCTTGQMYNDANFIYVCTATNNWRRAALSSY